VCAGCRKQCFTDNDLHITVKALYVPKDTEFYECTTSA
jgi:hypothetical protein